MSGDWCSPSLLVTARFGSLIIPPPHTHTFPLIMSELCFLHGGEKVERGQLPG